MRAAVVVSFVLAALVALAGCNGAAPGEPTPEATPTPEPTPERTPHPPSALKGGEVNADELASGHRRTLRNASFQLEREIVVRHANGTLLREHNRTIHSDGDRRLIHHEATTERRTSRYERWSDGSAAFTKQEVGDRTSYNAHQEPIEAVTHRDRLYAVFGAIETPVTGRTAADGDVRYHVLGLRFSENRSLDPPSAGTDVEFAAAIDDEGVVRRYELSYAAAVRGERVRVHERFRVGGVGATSVERPGWVDEAEAEAGTRTPSE